MHTYSNVIKDVIMGKDDVVFVGKQITEQQTCKVLEIFIFKTLRFLHPLSYKNNDDFVMSIAWSSNIDIDKYINEIIRLLERSQLANTDKRVQHVEKEYKKV